MTEPPPRVVVVGGGLGGLVAAYRLLHGPDGAGTGAEVTVVEATERLGGAVRSIELDGIGVGVEAGPDSFVVRKPWAVELCDELGLASRLVSPGANGAFVWARGALVPFPERSAFGIPSDAGTMLGWPGLSVRGRLRAATDLWRPARRVPAGGQPPDESIGSLVTRRLGEECARVLVGPLLAGINSGDPDRLSTAATFPELLAWERAYGSLIRGSREARHATRRARQQASAGPASSGARISRAMFATLRGGLSGLVAALVAAIGSERVALRAPVEGIERTGGALRVSAGGLELDADAVVLATPAFVSSALLTATNPDASEELASIAYGSSAVVALAYPPGTGERLPAGTGFIVPPGSVAGARPLTVTACTWLSRKWPESAFGDRAIVRAFVGRAGDEGALAMSDPELVATVVYDLDAVTPLGAAPEAAAIARWERAMPQYEVGHLDRVDRIDASLARTPGVFLTGSAYRGVGIADVVRQAGETADRVRAYLRMTEPAATSA